MELVNSESRDQCPRYSGSCIYTPFLQITVQKDFPEIRIFLDNSRHADGSHLPIKCPNDGAQTMKQYLNLKGFYWIVLMSLVDAEH